MRKVAITCVICVLCSAGFAETRIYTFSAGVSGVVQTGGIAGIHRKYPVAGQFQLSADSVGGAAWFDWVNATINESQFLRTSDLDELFNVTGLAGKVVSATRVEFAGKTNDNIQADVSIVVDFTADSVHLMGTNTPPCCDMFNYSLDAVAIGEAPGWAYHYVDDFSSDKAVEDSLSHSVFWPSEAFGPAEPYVFYIGKGDDRRLAFADYRGQPAYLSYRFPVGTMEADQPVKGNLRLDVKSIVNAEGPQSVSGYLLFSLSEDGVGWSIPAALGVGYQNVPLQSLNGQCYVMFLGMGAAIDNLDVGLYRPPATIRVPQDFGTIQQAIDQAVAGDVIEVAPGTYTGSGNWDIDFRGKAITVRSSGGAEKTIIDCGGQGATAGSAKWHRGFYFHEGEQYDSVLCGFTIRGGRVRGSEMPAETGRWSINPANPLGGGICCEFSSPSIVNCVIKDCGAEVGGGIGCVGAAPAIVDCLIESCTAGGLGSAESGGRGGGIGLIGGCDATITGCVIRNNSGYFNSQGGGIYCRNSIAGIALCDISSNSVGGSAQGGGLYCSGSSRLIVQQCVISGNAANAGAGVFTESWGVDAATDGASVYPYPRCYVRVTNCTIAQNKLSGPQMPPFPGGGIHSLWTDIIVKNSIVWYNEGTPAFIFGASSKSPVVYSDVERGFLGQGNISNDPLFASTSIPDYHLQSVYGRYDSGTGKWVIDSKHSPCIDAGDPRDPVGYEPMPNGGRINMGAYGGTREASKGMARLVYHVDGAGGSDLNTGLSRENAFATIRKAIAVAKDGDTVLVWPGVYKEEVAFSRKAITVQSAGDASVVVAPAGYAFSFFGAESSKSVLRNFVISNCGEGAVFCDGASPMLANLTVVDSLFGIVAYGGANPDISNCIFWNNAKGDLFGCKARYSCIQERAGAAGEGNISKDPIFADREDGDYHLQSEYGRYWTEHDVWVIDEKTSPCIDAGDPQGSPARERMPNGGRLNMGAYGGTPYASMSGWPLKGDLNRDGVVNMRDLAIMAADWLEMLPWATVPSANTPVVSPLDGLVIPDISEVKGYLAPGENRVEFSTHNKRRRSY